MYDICYAKTPEHRDAYIQYIDEEYNADRLTNIATEVARIVGATILNIAKQDYDPQGASVTMLIAEEHMDPEHPDDNHLERMYTGKEVPLPDAVVAHLDKSHITVHTYPESHPHGGISTFRADIDVSTCGQISPLKALNFLIESFGPDIVVADYRVRGFTRDVDGRKVFIDHKINSIQNYINRKYRDIYQMIDVTVFQENIFHTKMIIKDFDLDNYLFGTAKKELSIGDKRKIKLKLKKEMSEIFYGKNMPRI